MSKSSKIITIASVGCLIFFLASAYALFLPQQGDVRDESPAIAGEEDISQAQLKEFFVKNSEGYVTVYSSDNPEVPMEVTSIAVKTLPKADQKTLERGVLILGEENLSMFLEDFGP